GSHKSQIHISFGVPQGSCLGPLIFSLRIYLIRKHNIVFHIYADDSQLYISVQPNDKNSLSSLTACLPAIKKCMSSNFLKLTK
ncbi:hypothetical protein LDENG_00087180, partial [Lucifuga dentata]